MMVGGALDLFNATTRVVSRSVAEGVEGEFHDDRSTMASPHEPLAAAAGAG